MSLHVGRVTNCRSGSRSFSGTGQRTFVFPGRVPASRCPFRAPAHPNKAHALVRSLPSINLRTRATDASTPATAADGSSEVDVGIHGVEELRGVRANLDGQDPVVEYRVHWKDGSPDTWELATNVSPDLIRDFDERWWQAAKKGDADTLSSMLKYGKDMLSQVVDENRRSALHFVAAIGSVKCVKLLADAGADLDLQDKEGYTPLHMACGYMQTGCMTALLEAGADPLIKDKQGRDVVTLVDKLRGSLPPSMGALQRIMALEQVASGLIDRLYEEVEPDRILDERPAAAGEGREFLVQYKDDVPDEWVPESLIAADILDDWNKQLERAPVAALLDVQQWGTSREYLVHWADGTPDTWEPEENVPLELVEELKAAQPALFRGLKMAVGKKKKRKSKAAKTQQSAQQQGGAAGLKHASSSSSSSSSSNAADHVNGQLDNGSNRIAYAGGAVQQQSRERETVSAG